MSSRPPPVPPASRSPKGPGEPATVRKNPAAAEPPPASEKTGQQANMKINTTHQGQQQDR